MQRDETGVTRHDVIMPALGMAQDTGLLVSWLKQPGDAVAKGDVLFEVETDKSTMEVEAQADGYLVGVTASAGDEVPVGQTIARIADSPEDSAAPAPAPQTDAPALPDGKTVIMPALGMAQDTGLIVAWHKAPGDAVVASDILFEVETDKSTVEVEAGFDGFVAALLAEAGEEAPVGETIAIISADKPDTPVQRSRAGGNASVAAAAAGATTPVAPDQAKAPPPKPAEKPAEKRAPAPAAKPRANDRILATPKARRLAHEQGLDLQRLVDAGYPQPYHAADIETLKSLPADAPAPQPTAQSRHLSARVETDGFAAFATWAAKEAGLSDSNALLAGLAGACLEKAGATIAVESFGQTHLYTVTGPALSSVTTTEAGATPDLILRDLRMTRVTGVQMGPEGAPVLTLTRAGDGLDLTLECAASQLHASAAVTLLSDFAGRMEQPLRHLL